MTRQLDKEPLRERLPTKLRSGHGDLLHRRIRVIFTRWPDED